MNCDAVSGQNYIYMQKKAHAKYVETSSKASAFHKIVLKDTKNIHQTKLKILYCIECRHEMMYINQMTILSWGRTHLSICPPSGVFNMSLLCFLYYSLVTLGTNNNF